MLLKGRHNPGCQYMYVYVDIHFRFLFIYIHIYIIGTSNYASGGSKQLRVTNVV